MKRIVLTGIVGVFLLGMASCGGGGHTCDAYRTSDYTKYKSEKAQQVDIQGIAKLIKEK